MNIAIRFLFLFLAFLLINNYTNKTYYFGQQHAYYLDYEDRRSDYVSTFLEKLVSWETVESRLKKAVQRAVERDEYVSTKHIRKQLLARAKSQIRAMPQQVNGDAREQTSGQEKSLGV